ncbi:DUF485 domain-containing protein [Nocardioides sp. TRM66260-LWL]|uniref:DUF485 domain-containing protein n=1 Tax=Nocardioides sp. TRM66260-LWL TaxID=2874478 RepID=UPI001CC411C9|nr:DUF485 domain-containing protein [Nocardioides sp. TRM66260-LWL]MBZ5736338.1 DUF485 domain-containing protein [Nocardioides sp. TRM66260-LWL]
MTPPPGSDAALAEPAASSSAPGSAAPDVYDRLAATPEFAELRHRYRSFVLPATVAFLGWYLLYVVLSNWAGGLMGTKVVGNVNVALVFGLLQFVTTFAIAYVYSRYSTARLDPLARELDERYAAATARTTDRTTEDGGAPR